MQVHFVAREKGPERLVHPREVFKPAIMAGFCAALLLAHNLPSGDPEPSSEDLALTRRLASASALSSARPPDS